jgi:hypothetical protein
LLSMCFVISHRTSQSSKKVTRRLGLFPMNPIYPE